ncbi:MAG: Na+/H+ antiporter NhaA [Cyclobacteriaceae bacterium]
MQTALTNLFNKFFHSEKSGGIILIFCTAFSLLMANLYEDSYTGLWNLSFSGHTLVYWINDGLMAIFFLLIGLELEREIYVGELADLRSALLPVLAALGGMLVPAGIFLLLNWGDEGADGAGIPMATDIAFALGVLSMLGKRVPASLKIFLTALAVIDDLGAIMIIAAFYTKTFNLASFGIAMGIFVALLILNRLKVHNLLPYLAGGIFMWYYMLSSGVHATITGVLLAFAIPFGSGDEKSPSHILQSLLHVPVAYVILPLFALANTCILIDHPAIATLGSAVSLGIIAGLFFGKPLGIFLFSYLTTAFKISSLPPELRWAHIIGAGILAGIGFTMSIFITLLAYEEQALIDTSKLSVMVASLLAGGVGFIWLKISFARYPANDQADGQ